MSRRNIYQSTIKYHNKKTEIDGVVFDSRKEALRWHELKLMEKAGLISDLRRQVPFSLIPNLKDDSGKVIERAVKYIADFCYIQNGEAVVEDVKGIRSKDYILKRKMMLYFHGIRVKEI
jgi:hypothetical protein